MAWLFSSSATPQQQYDQLLEEATSELLPTPPLNGAPSPDTLDKCLRMSDMVRSGQVKAADAVRGFRRRAAHANPNVQLLTLLALDVAIKNSGDAFLREVASGSSTSVAYISTSADVPLVETIGSLARTSSNHDVRLTTLRLLQNWSIAFESRPNLAISELVLMYRRLKAEGVNFPAKDPSATAAMIDSMAAPDWKESDVCSRCRDAFSLTNRRHHCRNCGEIFDQKCSSRTAALPHFGIAQEVRVCDGCYKKLKTGRRASLDISGSPRPTVPSRSSSVRSPTTLRPRSPLAPTRSAQQEYDDLQLALRLSLADVQPTGRPGYRGPSSAPSHPPVPVTEANGEDPELAAAIEASLREARAPQPSAPYSESQSASDAPTRPARGLPAPVDMSPSDTDALLSFAQMRAQLGYGLHDIAPLYDRATAARPNLVRSVADASRRHQVLMDMSDKLTSAVKLYDGLLEQQVARHAYRPQPAWEGRVSAHDSAVGQRVPYQAVSSPPPRSASVIPSVYPSPYQAAYERRLPDAAPRPVEHPVHQPAQLRPTPPIHNSERRPQYVASARSPEPAVVEPSNAQPHQRYYNAQSFPTVPSSNPWASGPAAEERVEAPLIEF